MYILRKLSCSRYFNVHKGCSRGNMCHSLHMCLSYVLKSCKFGKGCKRNHDVDHPQVSCSCSKDTFALTYQGRQLQRKAKVEKQMADGQCAALGKLKTINNQLLSLLHPLGCGKTTFLGACVACLCSLSHSTLRHPRATSFAVDSIARGDFQVNK